MNLTTHNIVELAESFGFERRHDGVWTANTEELIALVKAAHEEGRTTERSEA